MAKPFSPEYTCADVLGLYRVRSEDGDERRLRRLAREFRQLCRLEHEVTIPEQYKAITKEVRTPYVRDARDRIASSLVAKPPVTHITPLDDDRVDSRDVANVAERFDQAAVERMNKERSQDIDYNLAAQLTRDGESVLKVVHRPDAWANFPPRTNDESAEEYTGRTLRHKKTADLPIAWRDVDRLTIVREGGEYGDEWILEYGEYARPYLRSKYNMAERSDSGGFGALVNPESTLESHALPEGLQQSATGRSVKVEFFTDHEWHVIVDGSEAPGYPKPNPYAPYLPYFVAPAYEGESLLYSLLFLVPRLDELLTMKLNWSFLGAYPNPVIESVAGPTGLPPFGDPGDVAGQSGPKPLTWTPGKVIQLPEGMKISFLVPPPVGADINQLIMIFKGLIDIAGVPSIMRGMSGSGDSGYLANQLRAAAEMAYKIATLSLQRQREKALEFTHWLVPNIVGQRVYVKGWSQLKNGKKTKSAEQQWLALGTEDDNPSKTVAPVHLLGPVNCQYRPTLPTDRQANAMIALQLTNAQRPLYDVRHALETLMEEEDPDAIIDAIYVQKKIDEDPQLDTIVTGNALRESGLVPPAPPTPPPGMGLVGPNGMPISSGAQVLPPGPNDLNPVPLANAAPPGVGGIRGLTMPITPTAPQQRGVPGHAGGRAGGMFPGQPGGPHKE